MFFATFAIVLVVLLAGFALWVSLSSAFDRVQADTIRKGTRPARNVNGGRYMGADRNGGSLAW